MSSVNIAVLIGRPTDNPEIRQTQDGKKVARWTLAVDRRGDGADFVSCNAWNTTAELVEKYVKKGMQIAVEGRIKTGSYTDKDNKRVYTTDVVAHSVQFLGKKGSAKEEAKEEVNESDDEFMNIPDSIDEELPFN